MILIDALFIANQGGGPNLLRYFLDKIRQQSNEKEFYLLLDKRFEHDVSGFQYQRMNGSLRNRRKFYRENRYNFSKVFCFANTPPPLKLDVPVDTYFHNLMLLESRKHRFEKKYLRYYLRYLFVKLFNKNTDHDIVQTKHMVEEMVASGLKKQGEIKTFPFYRLNPPAYDNQRGNDFVYISSASFYKNHLRLLKAWEYLYDSGIKPVLHLTVDKASEEIFSLIEVLKAKGVKIVNHGYTDPHALYSRCKYLIYPSLFESFGLGLIEAATAGLKVIAADRPYVKSVIEPSLSFDPLDIQTIADVVSFALKNEIPAANVLVKDEADKLIEYLLN